MTVPRRRLHGAVSVAEGRSRLRRLGGQHDAADQPAVGLVRRQARRCRRTTTIGDELSAAGSRLGVVRRRLGQRRRRHRGPGGRTARADVLGSESRSDARRITTRSARTTRSSSTTSRSMYYANYAPGRTAGRAHLRDEAEFEQLRSSSTCQCKLDAVSFVKPIGEENEHPGYASEPNGSDAPGRRCCR